MKNEHDPKDELTEADVFVNDRIKELRTHHLTRGRIVLNAGFDDKTLEHVYLELVRLTEDANIADITIYINSNGGYVNALFPLSDFILSSKKPISTIAIGKAYSAGAMLLLSGHKGRRKAYRHTDILLHEVAGGAYGKTSQVDLDARHMQHLNDELRALIKAQTKMTDKQIERFMSSTRDEFITAEEALRLGIIDAIL